MLDDLDFDVKKIISSCSFCGKKVKKMIEFIDTLFYPVISWLSQLKEFINDLSVPASRGLKIEYYLGPFAQLGGWTAFITTGIALGFTYLVTFCIIAYKGVFIKFKNVIKWW